jgi:galactokinase
MLDRMAQGVEQPTVRAFAPGRVNLIGDHTDYNEGVALPMAIDLGTVVTFSPDGGYRVVLRSAGEPDPADVDVHFPMDPDKLQAVEPRWARYVAGMVAAVRPYTGGRGTVETNLPVGAGLGSSAALEVAVSLALGFEGQPVTMARTCQRAEQAATGVPTGLMDQWIVTGGIAGCALLLDFAEMAAAPVTIPEGAEIVVVHSGERRSLDRSGYAARRAECEAAAYRLGPLGRVDANDVNAIRDPVLRKRARHVMTECERVRWFAHALFEGNLEAAGQHMTASHVSLAQDFEVSTTALDELVGRLVVTPGVYGARLTGAGFGGCAVALADPGAVDVVAMKTPAWRVRASDGAHLLSAR